MGFGGRVCFNSIFAALLLMRLFSGFSILLSLVFFPILKDWHNNTTSQVFVWHIVGAQQSSFPLFYLSPTPAHNVTKLDSWGLEFDPPNSTKLMYNSYACV